jgi:3-isopropylmalate dehydrogenase
MGIKLAVIGGDGIGPEVTAEALKVLQSAGIKADETTYDLGAQRWHRTGETLPDSVLD